MQSIRQKIKPYFCIVLSMIFALVSIFSINYTMVEAAGNEYGNISFTTPGESSSYSTYNAHVYFAQVATWGGYGTVSESQTLDVTYEYADGTIIIMPIQFSITYDNDLGLSKLYADLSSIPAACTVTVSNIQIVRDETTDSWKNYPSTEGAVILTSNDISETVTALFNGLQPITSDSTTVFEFSSEGGGGSTGEETSENATAVITVPSEGTTYNAHIYITRAGEWGNLSISSAETYNVTYVYPNGSTQTVATTFNTQYDSANSHSELYLNLTNITAGTVITISDIPASKIDGNWDDYLSSNIGVELTSTDENEVVTPVGDLELTLASGSVSTFDFVVTSDQAQESTTQEQTTQETTTETTTQEETTQQVIENQYANVSVIIPNDNVEGKTYDMHLHFVRYSQWGDFVSINTAETYAVTYTYLDGTSETISQTFNVQYDEDDEHAEIYLDVSDIPAGTIIIVSDVQISRNEADTWNNYVETHTAVELTSSDPTEIISTLGETNRTLTANSTEVFMFTSEYGEAVGGTQYSNLSVIVPDDSTAGKTYEVNIYISRYNELGDFVTINASELYEVTYTYADGTSETLVTKFNYKYDDVDEHSELYITLEDIAAGTVITVNDIQITRDESDTWNNYDSSVAEVLIYSTEISELFSCLTENPTTLLTDETTVFEFESYESEVKRLTDDTFTSLGGEYTLLYLLSNYNAVSFDDIEATHIVGPIIAQAGAYRTDEKAFTDEVNTSTTDLVVSDYSKGVSSYVGTLSSSYGDSTISSLQLGYGYDRLYYADFDVPYFYTRSTELTDSSYDIFVQERLIHNELVDYIILEIDGSEFISPNDHGQALTYQTDNFMDFDYLQELMIQASNDLVENGRIDEEVEINVVTEAITTLTITAGESWTITDASKLTTVNILLPDDYDYYTNSVLEATTINIIDDTINPTYIDGVLHSQFPIVLVDGEQITVFSGENGEYGEVGNKIIWNLPNIVTDSESGYNRLVFLGSGSNIAGHILAPQAEVWNYKEYEDGVYWEGGNINGTIIAADIHSGNMEMHMWPYDGAAEGGIFTSIEVEKTFTNGDISDTSFSFELNQIEGENYDGLLNIGFPLTATTDESGIATFQTIVFNEAGTYNFTLTEVIPADTLNINYDLSEYYVTIIVTENEDNFITTQMIYKLSVDAEGNELQTLVEVDKITYENIAIEDVPVTYSLYKTNQYDEFVAGAEFELYEFYSNESFDNLSDDYTEYIDCDSGCYEELTSDNNGLIYIENLEKGEDYVLVEVQSPEDHVISDGYWILSVSEAGRVSVTAIGGADDIVNNELYNECTIDYNVDVTVYKQNEYGKLLAGAHFEVYEIVSLDDLRQVSGGYYETYEVDSNEGKFTITGLETGLVYMLVETQAPVGYIQETGSWIITVTTGDDFTPQVNFISVDGAPDIVDNIIINYAEYFELPEVGGVGTLMYYTIGMVLACFAVVLMTYKARKNNKRRKIF